MSDEYTSGPESDPIRPDGDGGPGPSGGQSSGQPAGEPARMSPVPPPGSPAVPPADAAATPPTHRGEMSMPMRQTTWPTVLGVIMIILGSLGALGGCFGMLGPWLGQMFMSMLPEDDPGRASMEASFGSPGVMVGISIVTLGVAVFLIVVGVAVMRRRAWSRTGVLTWAMLKMVFVLASAMVQYPVQKRAMEAQTEMMGSGPNAPPPGLMTFMEGAVVFGLGIGVLWGWALPIFLLIWFNLKGKKAEIATWK